MINMLPSKWLLNGQYLTTELSLHNYFPMIHMFIIYHRYGPLALFISLILILCRKIPQQTETMKLYTKYINFHDF